MKYSCHRLYTMTQNGLHLFLMMSPNQLYIIQFRVPKQTQNVALNVDTNNGWKQY